MSDGLGTLTWRFEYCPRYCESVRGQLQKTKSILSRRFITALVQACFRREES